MEKDLIDSPDILDVPELQPAPKPKPKPVQRKPGGRAACKRPKSKTKDRDLINREYLLHLVKQLDTAQTKRDRALIVFLYLTGARISEVVRSIKRKDITIETFKEKKVLLIENVKCLKRKPHNAAKRNIPIPVEREKQFVQVLADYFDGLGAEDYLFPISRQMAYNVVRQLKDELFPHYFRHLRCSHLASIYGFNSADLRGLTGWTDDKPAATYVHLNWRDLASKFI